MNNSPDILQFRNISHSEYKWAAITNESLQLLSDEVDNPAALSFIDDILNYENSPAERYSRINHLMNTNRSTDALVLLNDMSSDYELNTAEADEQLAVVPLYELEADLQSGIALSSSAENNLWALTNSPFDHVMMKAFSLLMGYTGMGTYDPLFDDDGEHALKSLRLKDAETPTIAILYPNPAQDFVMIKLAPLHDAAKIKLTNALGETMKEFVLNANSTELSIDIHDLDSGIYFTSLWNVQGTLLQNLSFVKL